MKIRRHNGKSKLTGFIPVGKIKGGNINDIDLTDTVKMYNDLRLPRRVYELIKEGLLNTFKDDFVKN
jgi:hypothetical protein